MEQPPNPLDSMLLRLIDPDEYFLDYNAVTLPIINSIEDPADIPSREAVLISQARDAALMAQRHYERLDVPFRRPSDFFCEEVRDEGLMRRVREAQREAEDRVRRAQEARLAREARRESRRIQARERLRRVEDERAAKEAIEEWKKRHASATTEEEGPGLEQFVISRLRRNERERRAKRGRRDKRYGIPVHDKRNTRRSFLGLDEGKKRGRRN